MRRVFASLTLILFAGCASSTGSRATSGTRPATQTIGGSSVGSVTVAPTTTADVTHLLHSTDAVWRVLPSIFDSLGITVTVINPGTKTIGNSGYKIRQRLGKTSLSRYLDCGNTQIGPNADSYEVFLSVLTTVAPEGATGAILSTVVDAQARPISFNQGYSRCSSKGGIETRVADLVKVRLGR